MCCIFHKKIFIISFIYFLIIFSIPVSIGNAENYYELVYDRHISMYAGTKTLKSVYSFTCNLTENLIMDNLIVESSFKNDALGIILRSSKLILFDFPFAYIAFIFQHEYMGHGSLPRKLNWETQYTFFYPFPYGRGGAIIEIVDIEKYYNDLSYSEQAYTTTSGVESSQYLSKEIQKEFYIKGKTHYTDLLLYGINKLDISVYILSTRPSVWSGDINSFIYELPRSIGQSLDLDELYENLKLGAIWNIIDPTLWIAGYHGLKYIVNGERISKIPMFKLGETYFMPATRFSLTPIGYEYYFDLMILDNKTLYSTYFRKGRGGEDFYYGSGIGIDNIILFENLSIGINTDIWKQIIIETTAEYYDERKEILAGNLNFDCKFIPLNNFGITLSIGYKEKGYLIGRPYEKGAYGYAGIIFGF